MQIRNVKISTIIPVFNAKKYLDKCLKSVLLQTYQNLEIIVVDDCSTDGSCEVLEKYQERFSNIKLVFQKEHTNAGKCRNVGLKYATGEYVHFLDADDWLDPKAYECVMKNIGAKNIDVCVFQYHTFDDKSAKSTGVVNVMTNQKQIVSFKQYPYFLIGSPVVPWNKLIKKSVIDQNNLMFDELYCANDRTFYFRLIKVARKILIIKDKLIFYRINNESSLIGSGRIKNFNCIFEAFESSLLEFASQKEKYKRALVDAYIRDIIYFYRKIPQKNVYEIENQISEFFTKNPDIVDKKSEMFPVVEKIKNGKFNNLLENVEFRKNSIFKNGVFSGMKLIFFKIKDKFFKEVSNE